MGWLIALGVLLLLALMPLGVRFAYDDSGADLRLLVGPFPAKLTFGGKKKEKKQKKQPKEKTGTSGKGTSKSGGSLTDFLPLLDTFLDLLSDFRRKLRIRSLRARLILGGDDPCDLAISYGSAQAALGNLIALLENSFVIQKRDVEVECDFTSEKTTITFYAVLVMPLYRLLWLVLRYGIQALRQYLAIHNQHKGGAKNESKTSQYVRKYHRKNP